MDISASPLVQQERPTFQPKIVSLYEELFQHSETDSIERSDGFWTEFFLLKPHPPGIKAVLEPLSGDDLLHLQPQTQQLFVRAVACVKKGHTPSDEFALDTLSSFLNEVLSKRYTNLSSDAIAILAGLDRVDVVFTDFVHILESYIKNGRTVELRYKAVHVALVMACGGFHTGLLSYFTHRDLFPAIMKYINDPSTSSQGFEPFVLLGVLANYNKFEFQNPYQLRLADFVNESAIRQIVYTIGDASARGRQAYIDIMDDMPENWNIGNVLNMVGLGGLLAATRLTRRPSVQTVIKPDQNEEVQKASFTELPGPPATILLSTYDFVSANKLFAFTFISSRSMTPDVVTTSNKTEPPFATYLSFSSYLIHHAHRSSRAALYAKLNMLVLRVLVEDSGVSKRLISDELKTEVRFCIQRQPFLPVVRGVRTLMAAILDISIDGIGHNLRKKLDVDLYILFLGLILRIISFLVRARIRLAYHWQELWRCLLSLLRFFTAHHDELKDRHDLSILLNTLVNLIALSLSSGDAFLPGPAEYDDLFYKLVETGDVLVKFRDAYGLDKSSNISTLVSVSEHYYRLIDENRSKSGRRNLTPAQVAEVIKNGYETLAITGASKEGGLAEWEKYREADERVFLKKTARVVVMDVKNMVDEEQD